MGMSAYQLIHSFCPASSISATLGKITSKYCTDVYDSDRIPTRLTCLALSEIEMIAKKLDIGGQQATFCNGFCDLLIFIFNKNLYFNQLYAKKNIFLSASATHCVER